MARTSGLNWPSVPCSKSGGATLMPLFDPLTPSIKTRLALKCGRVCTMRRARGRGHTTRLLQAALAEVGDYPCRIDAQTYLEPMYGQHGFVRDGAEFVEDGVPHVPMVRPGRSEDQP